MAKFESVALSELKTRLPAKLLPLVEEYKDKLEKLNVDQGGRRAQPADPVPVPRGRGGGELLPREVPGAEAEGGVWHRS